MILLGWDAGILGSASMFQVLGDRWGMFGRWLVGLRVWMRVMAASHEGISVCAVGRSSRIFIWPV